MKLIQRSRSGVWRCPLWRGWAVGIDFERPWPLWHVTRRGWLPGWSLRVLWLYVGWAPRETWTHYYAPSDGK